jgi:hypothetical protein
MIAAISSSKDKNLLHQKTLGHYIGRSLIKKTVTKFVSLLLPLLFLCKNDLTAQKAHIIDRKGWL